VKLADTSNWTDQRWEQEQEAEEKLRRIDAQALTVDARGRGFKGNFAPSWLELYHLVAS
jgi:tRNA-dihydrouridine synthase